MPWCNLCLFTSARVWCEVTQLGWDVLPVQMSSTMWYIMQSIQSKYSLSERLIRTIAAIRSFPHDNVEDLIRKVNLIATCHSQLWCILYHVQKCTYLISCLPRGQMSTECMERWSHFIVLAWWLMLTVLSFCWRKEQRYAATTTFLY